MTTAVAFTIHLGWTWLWALPALACLIIAGASVASLYKGLRARTWSTVIFELISLALFVAAMIACFDRV